MGQIHVERTQKSEGENERKRKILEAKLQKAAIPRTKSEEQVSNLIAALFSATAPLDQPGEQIAAACALAKVRAS
jgi:hypothetical protein